MKIALAQTNPTIGDIAGNADQIGGAIEQARQQDAQLVIFPELSIIGYPPKDLLLVPDMIDQCGTAVDQLAANCVGICAIIGFPWPTGKPRGLPLHNGAAFCVDGRIAHRHVKSLLPTYDVFDEQRYFEPSRDEAQPYAFGGVRFGLTICEDLWNDRNLLSRQLYHENPVARLVDAGAQILVNCSASPFVVDKHRFRLELAAAAARRHRVPVIYCNQVGGNDELVFDGNSFVVNADGQLVAHARDFQTDLLLFELDGEPPDPAATGQRPA
ncbi:MAG: nitrilase-related carbon-nitrogen hydrolase, partial [Pirellulaceae bacterium]|nr:nitrilase-related carbon-nitrogen hydrolase [Pirellulaceae bacterium]